MRLKVDFHVYTIAIQKSFIIYFLLEDIQRRTFNLSMYLPSGGLKFFISSFPSFASSLFSQDRAIRSFSFQKKTAISEGQALFTEIPDASSGLTFNLGNKGIDRPELESNPFFVTRKQAIGVCAGDFDNDGLDDIFFAHSYGGHRLFHNLGGLRFKDVTDELSLTEVFKNHWAVGCSFVDINGDGWLDLIIAGTGDPNLVLINKSGSLLWKCRSHWSPIEKVQVCRWHFSDFDRDGDLDGYLVTNRFNTLPGPQKGMGKAEMGQGKVTVEEQYDEVFTIVPHPEEKYRVVNAGSGISFIAMIMESSLKYLCPRNRWHRRRTCRSWFDYDRDGWPDLYVANDFLWSRSAVPKSGRKRFEEVTNRVLPHIPWFSMGTDVGDINNDGWPDLMTSDMAGSDHYKSKMGMGRYGRQWMVPSQFQPKTIYEELTLFKFRH